MSSNLSTLTFSWFTLRIWNFKNPSVYKFAFSQSSSRRSNYWTPKKCKKCDRVNLLGVVSNHPGVVQTTCRKRSNATQVDGTAPFHKSLQDAHWRRFYNGKSPAKMHCQKQRSKLPKAMLLFYQQCFQIADKIPSIHAMLLHHSKLLQVVIWPVLSRFHCFEKDLKTIPFQSSHLRKLLWVMIVKLVHRQSHGDEFRK